MTSEKTWLSYTDPETTYLPAGVQKFLAFLTLAKITNVNPKPKWILNIMYNFLCQSIKSRDVIGNLL